MGIFLLEGCYGFSFGEILKDSLMHHEKKKNSFPVTETVSSSTVAFILISLCKHQLIPQAILGGKLYSLHFVLLEIGDRSLASSSSFCGLASLLFGLFIRWKRDEN